MQPRILAVLITGTMLALTFFGAPHLTGMASNGPCTTESDANGGGTGNSGTTSSDFTSQPGCVGGGDCYNNKVTASDADIIVQSASRSSLKDALSQASSGEIVFVPGDMEIEMGFDARMKIPAGVTLASNRGVNGADGALLYTNNLVKESSDHERMIMGSDNIRITGLRIRGPRKTSTWYKPSYYADGGGIDVEGTSNVEVDNNEIYGFEYQGVGAGDASHIHHNYIHHHAREGLGYGVSVTATNPAIVEYNEMDWNRHHIATHDSQSYEFRYNHIGPNGIIHSIDVHDRGQTIRIHHNTVEFTENANVRIRGTPRNVAEIHHNWFYPSKSEALDLQGSSSTYEVYDNHYGEDEPGCEYGAPRSSCPNIGQ